MPTWLVVVLAVIVAQAPAKKATETEHLVVTTSVAPEAAGSGRKVPLYVDVEPKPQMHVYAPGQEGYITIALTLDASASFEAAKAKYPTGEKVLMPLLNETQLVYGKPFRITQEVTIRAAAAPGPLTIKGTLRYQACDDKLCYRPVTVPLTWTINRD